MGNGLSTGCAIAVSGELVMTPDAPQPFEIRAEAIVLEGSCPSDYPLQKKRHTLEYLRTIQHLRPRTNTFQATFRVRSVVAAAIHEFFQQNGFVYVHTPLITGSDCEGAGEMFQVTTLPLKDMPKDADGNIDFSGDFFGKPARITSYNVCYTKLLRKKEMCMKNHLKNVISSLPSKLFFALSSRNLLNWMPDKPYLSALWQAHFHQAYPWT